MLPSALHAPPQVQPRLSSRGSAHAVAVAAATAPSTKIAQRLSKENSQSAQQQQQQQPWVSNDKLWRLSIQHKHAQRRRKQHLQQLQPEMTSQLEPTFQGSGQQAGPDVVDSIRTALLAQHQQSSPLQLSSAETTAAVHQSQGLYLQQQQQQQQQQEQVQQQSSVLSDPRTLTRAIGCAGDAGQLLLLLFNAQQQCDAIHVSAAVNQCARGMILDLQLPLEAHAQQQQQQQPAYYEGTGQLHWLRSLPAGFAHQQTQLWLNQQQQSQQQQQQQQQQGLSTDWLLLLTLCRLVQQHAGSMSSQQLCTCLNGFTQLLQQHTQLPLLLVPPLRAACQQLLLSAHTQLQHMDPRGLSLVLHAAAGMACCQGGFSPASGFMLGWYRASMRRLGAFNHLDLSMCAGALGRMQLFPPAEWMNKFWSSSKAALPTFPVHELLLLLLGVAGTRRKPPAGWMPAALAQLQPSLHDMSPAQLSTAVMACAQLNHVLSVAWLSGFWAAWEAKQLGFSARGHATVMWGVGVVQPVAPDQAQWARKLQGALQQAVARAATAVAAVALQRIRLAAQKERLVQQEQLEHQEAQQGTQIEAQAQLQGTGSAQQLHQDVSAAAHDTLQPPTLPEQLQQQRQQQQQQQAQAYAHDQGPDPQYDPQQLELLQSAMQQQQEQPALLASASLLHPTDCAMVLYGLARLGPSALDTNFPAFWLAQSRAQLVNMNSQELATCIWSLGKLRLLPPEAWLQQALHATAGVATCMNHKQLAMVWWGCARLRYLPHVSVTAELLMCAAEQLPRFTPHSLALMLWSLGALRMRPNKEWMKLVLAHIEGNLQLFDGQDFCGVLCGVYALGYHPGRAWLDRYTGALATKIQVVTPKQHERILAVLKAFGYSGQRKGFAWVMDPVAVAAMCDRDVGTGSRS